MKKKIALSILTVTLFIAGCASINVSAKQDEMLVVVEASSYYTIYADKDTGVMYLWMMGPYKGGITVMLNADGTPKIWQEGN